MKASTTTTSTRPALAATALEPRASLRSLPWLFSPAVDLAAFLGSALLSLALVAMGGWYGWLDQDVPEWTWIGAILLVDVAHVYATSFRVYFAPAELQRRPWLYGLTPLVAFGVGAVLYQASTLWFWRVLAYLAVFHFVRQQYGWVRLYRAKGGERDRLGAWIDGLAIYASMLYPLVYWHAHLPRKFWWFLSDDFLSIPATVAEIAFWPYVAALAAYFTHSAWRGLGQGSWSPGKDVVMLTTAVCWYVGIVALDSDYAFTVTNVIIHGVPYMVLVYWYNIRLVHGPTDAAPRVVSTPWRSAIVFVATLWLLAYMEELCWDRSLWHERGWLFGPAWELSAAHAWLAPLLAVPQITHYVLDGFIWRRRSNPDLAATIR